MKYYYYTYVTSRRDDGKNDFWSNIFYGDISDKIIELENTKDKYYKRYIILSYFEITKDQYEKIQIII